MGTSGALCRVGAMVAPFISQVRACLIMLINIVLNTAIKYRDGPEIHPKKREDVINSLPTPYTECLGGPCQMQI